MAKPKSYNNNDSFDIGELASLNDEISDDLINQLHAKLSNDLSSNDNAFAETQNVNINDDSTLFEEPKEENSDQKAEQTQNEQTETNNEQITTETHTNTDNESNEEPDATEKSDTNNQTKKDDKKINTKFDDNFIKKYKAKLNKKANETKDVVDDSLKPRSTQQEKADNESIEKLSNGNITEKQITQELKEYNDSLDFLDGNVKYSKYVIYIEPENVDFIEGLSVKERKNLINNILRHQDDIELAKHRFKKMQILFMHAIIFILILAITIPASYLLVNASLEATIDNYRRSQTNWQVLYKQAGKINK